MANQQPQLVTTTAELRRLLAGVRRAGKRIGLVPTMGALHAGHLSLVHASQAECDCTVVSIFVNPTQFGPGEDFSRYPRTLPADLEALAACQAEVVFAPPDDEVYRAGFDTQVEPGAAARPLEGAHRPGHFRGVATVVLKLFHMVGADVAYFGQKDYQQTLVVRRMVADLDVPIEIRVCPTVREPDGLAMSSRNRYLGAEARQRALALWRSLCLAQQAVRSGRADAEAIGGQMCRILREAGAQIDYAGLFDLETLQPIGRVEGPVLAAIAARIDNTRLIDNVPVDPRG